MRYLKQLFTRRNWWVIALLAVEAALLLFRFAGDYGAGQTVTITPEQIVPYAEGALNDSRGTQIQDYTGVFATTRWFDLEPGSYRVSITYVTSGGDGSASFVDEIMPTARYDQVTLSSSRTRTVFSLWMPHGCENAQLQFSANGGVMFVTGAELIPTHAWAYVRFLTLAAFLLLADWCLLIAAGRLPFPIRSIKMRYSAAAIAGVVMLACLPLGFDYLIYGHDMSIHLTRIEGLKAGLLSGQFPVRMDPEIVNGKGYPFSLMYPDLLLYPAALLRILGFSLQQVYQMYVFGVTLATALVTRYCLKKMFASEGVALTGTALYLLSSYRLANVYVRAAVGEYSAMIFLPVVVYGLWRIYNQPKQGGRLAWLPLAVGFTGLLQTHLLTTEMVGLFTLLFCLARLKQTLRRPVLPLLCRAAGVALVWNLWFLVPMLQYMLTETCRISGKYDASTLRDSAAYLGQIFLMFGQGGGYSESLSVGLSAEMPLTVGTVLGFGALLFCLCLMDPALRRADRGVVRLGGWALAFGALGIWASSTLFPWYDIYQNIEWLSKLLGKLQFAWRFLGPATVLLVVCSCCALALLRRSRPDWLRAAAAVLVLLTVLPAGLLTYEVCRNSEVVSYQSLASIDNLADQVGGGEYMPYGMADGSENAWENTDPCFPEELTVSDYALGTLQAGFSCVNTSDQPVTAVLPLFSYPGYRLTAGEGAVLGESDGLIAVTLPAGYSGSVQVEFAGFWFWRLADAASLAGILVTVLLCRRRRGTAPAAPAAA
ncbi:MAG TPA: hypothetical protein H9915_00615 [Candidatus Gemmiger faecigallinarum]|nr:hypothetical protein [Candidatus Gemmiger faecigallinarum]